MPAAEPLPTTVELVNAFQGGLVSEEQYGDTHEGALYDHWAAVGAVTWRRLAERDQQEFTGLYFNAATGSRFDSYIENHFPGKARLAMSVGTGTVTLKRATAAAGAGTFWARTRIAVASLGSAGATYYQLPDDQDCGAADLTVTLNIEAMTAGPDSKIAVLSGDRPVLRVEDPLWDNTWQVERLVCGEGSLYESNEAARARIAAELVEERFGYESAIIKAMKGAGAATVALFRSDYLGEENDHGLNRIYVGDSNFETSDALLLACRLALPDCAIAGAGNQALAMTTVYLNFAVTVRFWDSPEKFDMESAQLATQAAVVEYFETRENPFFWDETGVKGAIRRAVQDTQEIEITPSQAAPSILAIFDTYPLPRYRTTLARVTVTLESPSS